MKNRLIFLALAFLLLFVRSTFAGVRGFMSDHQWFALSNKILVLEYENPFGGRGGVQLAELIGHMALATTTGVDKFAVVTLRQEKEHIPLTEKNVETLAVRQSAPVVVWGEFYEQNERIFVTSHLRYASMDTDPNVRLDPTERSQVKLSWDISKLKIPDRTQANASLPAAQVNFSPLELSSSDLSSLENAWFKTLTLHAKPDENSAEVGQLRLDTPYHVIGSSNGWTQVAIPRSTDFFSYYRTMLDMYVGWVRLGDLSQLHTFNELTGVVLYAQGLMQFSTKNYRAAAKTFTEYLEKYGSRQDSANQAVAHILIGYSILKGSGDRGLSLKEFETAKRLLPNSSSPVNCIALALFEKASRSAASEEEMRQLENDLIRVIQIDNDVDAIRNLESLYQVPQAAKYFKNNSGDFMQAREMQLRFLRNLEQQVQQQPNS
jgi:tetratricopeptide (TPR) repeat protein